MLSLIHPDVRNCVALLREEFQRNEPFRHVVMDRLLDPAFCERLMAEFPAFDARKAVNELGEAGRKAVVTDIARIGPACAQFDRLMRDRGFLALVGEIAGIANLVYDPEYIGGGTHENLDGQELDPHVDFNYHPNRPLHRRLNLVVFLNPEWDENWGGCLELFGDPWGDRDGVRTVAPIANRAVLFETTEQSWHGFKRLRLPDGVSRRSIAVYFYSVDRPFAETAPSHGTVYVPRPLPGHLQAGYTLTDEDAHEMQLLVARRDAQIRYLYGRELQFAKALSGVMRSPSYRLGRFLTGPARWLRAKLRS